MGEKRLVIHENEGERIPDICGVAIELINEETSTPKNVSLAVIILDPGKTSEPHYHKRTEEIYYILEGTAAIVINDNRYEVKPGHAILLPLNSVHQIINTAGVPLKLICADSPPFDPKDVFKD
jgi:mannose-6-phosphate isomerase-like protein (cupin superfamily)